MNKIQESSLTELKVSSLIYQNEPHPGLQFKPQQISRIKFMKTKCFEHSENKLDINSKI